MSIKSFVFCALAACATAALPAVAADVQAVQAGALSVAGGFTRATLPGATVAGGFLTIANAGTEADRLSSAAAPFAGRVELHQMAMEGSTMKMRALPDGIEIPPGKSVELVPGGLHLMFMDLKQPLKEGERVEVTLTFEHAGNVVVPLNVAAPAAKAAPMGNAMHGQQPAHNHGAAAPPAQ